MVNPKSTKIYMLLKRIYFIIIYFLLKSIGLKNRAYYFSKWVTYNGDEKLLIKYPLNSDSIVVDVGGYTGYFADKIIDLYHPHLIIFEPVKKYHYLLKKKYQNNPKIKLYQRGLAAKTSFDKIYLADDGTSLIKKSGRSEKIQLIDAAEFIRKIKNVDLMSINIEGAEYQVLERLIETNLINKIKYIQVQFHSFVPGADNRRRNILKNILKTHEVYFSYPFVWESFKLKN